MEERECVCEREREKERERMIESVCEREREKREIKQEREGERGEGESRVEMVASTVNI